MLCHIFLHVHKTGGTSVVENLWMPAVPLDDRHVEEDLIPGGVLHGRPYTYAEMYGLAYHHGLAYKDVFAAYWNVAKVPKYCRLYSGHMGYGVHEAIDGPCRYSTVLRHPIERTLSHYHLIQSLGVFDGDFGDYLDRGGIEVSNYQVKMLTRFGFCHSPGVTEGDLHEAIHHLETQFDFAVTEHIDAFVDGMIAKYRLPIDNRRAVVNRTDDAATVKGFPQRSHRRFPVDEALLPKLVAMNAFDLRLYEYAREASAKRWLGGVNAS